MGLSCCLCKCVLGLINGIVLVVGLLLAAVGGILFAMAKDPSFVGLEDTIKKIITGLNLIPSNSNANQIEFHQFLQPAAIIFLVVGCVVAGIAIIGYCGLSCYDIILKLYVIIISIILIVEIIVVALFFSGVFNSNIRSYTTEIIQDKYVDIDNYEIYSVIPNIIMINFQCCGLDGYQDFYSAKHWNSTREIIIDPNSNPVIVRMENLTTPIACCVTMGKFPNVEVVEQMCPVLPFALNATYNNYERGCWTAVQDDLRKYRTPAILIISAGFVIQALLIIGVALIIRDNDSK